VPAHLDDGTLVWTADIGGAKRLIVGKEAVTDGRVEVREVHDVDGDTVLFSASVDPTSVAVWTWSRASGAHPVDAGGAATSAGRRRGGTTVVARTSLAVPDVQVTVHRDQDLVARIASVAEAPLVTPAARMLELGERRLRAALLLPTGHTPGSGALPVLLDPYGGPGHQRVVTSHNAFLESQWFADQGFAVLVIDGRGTPGRGPAWARSIRGDIAGPVLEDQVDGLHAAAAKFADLDLSRVAIRGWSFGGYLAALAVLRRPDVFHAAVAGAPVTEQTLYDTHYTERYLGHPAREPDNYARASLIEDAPNLTRPLLLIHGLVDDNVVVAHTLRLSAALFAAGRPHTLLPLPGVTHSTNREDVAAVLPLLQLRFLQEALGLAVS
jgi:dipeptidyl-peptidase-4